MSGEFGRRSGGAHLQSQEPVYKKPISHTSTKERFREFYNKLGEDINQQEQTYNNQRMEVFIEYAKDPVIELGCHNGMNIVPLIKAGLRNITGVDCSKTLLSVARRKYNDSVGITLIESFIEDLPEDKKYKTVILTETLEHVIDPDTIVQKAKNILEKDGLLFYSGPEKLIGSEAHVRGITSEQIFNLLKRHGLEIFKWFPNIGDTIRLIAQHEK